MNFHNKVQKWLYGQEAVSSSQRQCCVVSGFNMRRWLTFTFVKEMVKRKSSESSFEGDIFTPQAAV